jgi:O-antigen/teichoic acid export membrane protein
MDFGVATVAVVTALVYIIGLGIKASPVNDKWIPVICGVAGILLGVAAMYLGMPDFPAADPLTAAAVGGVSGLAAVGIDQMGKQMKKND